MALRKPDEPRPLWIRPKAESPLGGCHLFDGQAFAWPGDEVPVQPFGAVIRENGLGLGFVVQGGEEAAGGGGELTSRPIDHGASGQGQADHPYCGQGQTRLDSAHGSLAPQNVCWISHAARAVALPRSLILTGSGARSTQRRSVSIFPLIFPQIRRHGRRNTRWRAVAETGVGLAMPLTRDERELIG